MNNQIFGYLPILKVEILFYEVLYILFFTTDGLFSLENAKHNAV